MAIVRELQRSVELIENEWVPLSDGTRLAAKIWLPEGAAESPVPAIFEFLPYRKGDGTVIRDELRYPWFAAHGYAGVRVDLRGSGESEGILDDEYSPQELADAVETIAWIADQEWCTGSVGMTGISWGGFNALQVAALQPPALKAIMTLCSTDDRYRDDVHYRGGAVEGLDMLHWSAYMLMANAQPPDPAIVGERWRDMWLARMEANEPLVATWLAHQRRDDYWKHGSVCEDYSAITCAVYAVGGWQDGYTNAIPRLLENLSCPRKGLIGPWGHKFPHTATPGPAIGFLQESLRFWDQWLKDEDTGVMDEPMLRAYVHDSVRPSTTYATRPGRWFADTAWPPPSATTRRWYLNADGLGDQPGGAAELQVSGKLATAIATSGTWCGEGASADSPDDQRTEDGVSLCFDSERLAEPVSFLGFPRVTLHLAADRPVAGLCVRLCEVFPDGASALVSRQIVNLTHRESDEHPAPMVPGEKTAVTVQLDANGHRFAAGSRIRVAVSPNYWPWMWPAPELVTLTVHAGSGCTLELPVLPAEFPEPPAFEEPEIPPPLPYETIAVGAACREITNDLVAGTTRMRFLWESGDDVLLPTGMRTRFENEAIYSIAEGEPLSASVLVKMAIEFEREDSDWMIRIETVSEMSCDQDTFRVTDRLDALENGARVRAQTWHHEIPRDLGMSGVEGRVALITGAGRGIGRATALLLASRGARVMATARSQEELEALGGIDWVTGDLASDADRERIVAETKRRLGPVDLLVNNAGLGSAHERRIWEQPPEVWRRTMDINLDAPYDLCRRIVGGMVDRGYGRCVFVASTAANLAETEGSAYSASKSGLLGLMRSVAQDAGARGVTSNAVLPGWVRTEMAERSARAEAEARGIATDEVWAERASLYPPGRVVEPQEIAETIAFLCSEESSGVSGEAIVVALGSPW